MSNLTNYENYDEIPVNIDTIFHSESAIDDEKMENSSFQYFGLDQLSLDDFIQNISNISDILIGRDVIDFIGGNSPFKTLFQMVAKDRKVTINMINPNIDVDLIESNMLTDCLVIADLPHNKMDEIVNYLFDKKETVICSLYIKDLPDSLKIKS